MASTPEVKGEADYVLVESKSASAELKAYNSTFIKNLRTAGLTIEIVEGKKYNEYNFITVKASDEVLNRLATVHGLYPIFKRDRTIPQFNGWLSFFKTPVLLKPNFQDPLFIRSSNTVKGRVCTTFSSAERIHLIYNVLKRVRYASDLYQYGVQNLIREKSIEDAYPLHDGTWQWTTTGPLNDRQILAKYWASWRMFYKLQPIHIIFKYYGSEIAYYYAWVQFYMVSLLIPSVIGVIVYLVGICDVYYSSDGVHRVNEVCESERLMCPSCTHKQCYYEKLEESCEDAKWAYPIDNIYTILFAVFVTIWASIAVEMWDREQTIYNYRWNLLKSSPEVDELTTYRMRLKKHRTYNPFSKTMEIYAPLYIKYSRYFVSFLGVLGLISLMFGVSLLVLISEHFIEYTIHKYPVGVILDCLDTIMKIYSAFMNCLIVRFFCPFIDSLAKILTDQEIHRTHEAYVSAFIFKSYIMEFINTYFTITYIAFFKTVYFTYPGDIAIYNRLFGIASNLCTPVVGCIINLSTNVTFMVFRDYITVMVFNAVEIVRAFKHLKKLKKYFKKSAAVEVIKLPQWEEEFTLEPQEFMCYPQSVMATVIEFGLILFFTPSTPLLPVLVLINNIVELRLTATALVKTSRRIVPRRVLGLGACRSVLTIVTRMGFVISGCVIAFTTSFIHRTYYFLEHKQSMKGFVNDTLSEFWVDDYRADIKNKLRTMYPDVDVCYYTGQKNSYTSANKYKYSHRFYELISVKITAVVIYVHAIYFFSGILSFYIQKVPQWIRRLQYFDFKGEAMELQEKIFGKAAKK